MGTLAAAGDGRVGRILYGLTTSANDFMAPIHDRMPVILGKADWEAWLDPDTGNPLLLQSMLKPCPDDWLECSVA